MPHYLNLSHRTWRQISTSWGIRLSGPLLRKYYAGFACSALARTQQWITSQAPIDNGPVIVLGYWRSGTTLLHELLSLDERFCFPSTYACVHPHSFVLTNAVASLRSKKMSRRPQDAMEMGWQTPQEDEFALMALGARSPYEGIIAPSQWGEAQRLCNPDDLSVVDQKRWERVFISFLRNVSFINNGRPIILKSPAHGFRVATIRKLLPSARFVVIVRNPFEILESMVGTVLAFVRTFGLGAPLSKDALREITLSERIRFERKLQDGLKGIPSQQLAIVKYEDLIRDPVATIGSIYEQLNLPDFDHVCKRITQNMGERRGYVSKNTLPNAHWKMRVSQTWADLFDRYGYKRGPKKDMAALPALVSGDQQCSHT
jgi:hypothetical protein